MAIACRQAKRYTTTGAQETRPEAYEKGRRAPPCRGQSLTLPYRPQLFRSHLSLALAARIVCHCRLETASGPPQASGTT
jgi:hypothetical protein